MSKKTYKSRQPVSQDLVISEIINPDISKHQFNKNKQNVTNTKFDKESRQWMQRHINDVYVARASQMGFRARSAFKIIELIDKYRLLSSYKKNLQILDLGAAPGSWSQALLYKADEMGQAAEVIAVDLINIEPIEERIKIITGDFTDEKIQKQILDSRKRARYFNLIVSDIAPNTTGIKSVDHLKIAEIAQLTIEFAKKFLSPGGHFVFKTFMGSTTQELAEKLRSLFKIVEYCKPDSSRKNSSEIYVICLKKIG